MRWLLFLLGIVLTIFLLWLALLFIEGRTERKKRASMSGDELFVVDLEADIRLRLGPDLFRVFTEDVPDSFYLNARDKAVAGLGRGPDEQRAFIQQLARELSVRKIEGLSRAEVAGSTDLHWFAYHRVSAEQFAHCLDYFQVETAKFDKPQLSRDVEATRRFRQIVFLKYGVDAAEPLVDSMDYSEFLPIRDSYLDALRLSEEGEGLKEGLEVLGSQHARARLVLDPGAPPLKSDDPPSPHRPDTRRPTVRTDPNDPATRTRAGPVGMPTSGSETDAQTAMATPTPRATSSTRSARLSNAHREAHRCIQAKWSLTELQ